MTGLALAIGLLAVATVPAQAASFRVSISASATVGSVGGKVTFVGKVSPKPSGRTLYLQRRYVGSTGWKTVKTFKAAKSGAYAVATRLSNDRDRYYRVYKKKAGSRKAGRSHAVQVIVNPAPIGALASLASISPASSPLAGGATVVASGTGFNGTTKVTITPQMPAAYTTDGSGVFPELTAGFTVSSDNQLKITTPASVAGTNLMKVYTPTATLTTHLTYTLTSRSPSAFEQQVLDQVNLRRNTSQVCRGKTMPGVGAVAWDGQLADITLSHARDLAARQGAGYSGLSHTTFGLKEWYHRFSLAGITGAFGEDLALSFSSYSAAQVVQQWMGSTDGHCESVMKAGWTKAGVGAAQGSWQGRSSIWTNLDLR